jgi:acetyl-CoA carboxylase, biotin carboxylase subunit
MNRIGKILIANRGEIAVRVARTCRDMGIRTVAVYSEADRDALHVRMADQAAAIGPAPARESYLDVERIVDAACKTGAHAIHPGYGFLSENPEFREACARAGIVFIGPSATAMRTMGNKTAARAAMRAAGVPVVPGDDGGPGGFADAAAALAAARRIGFPVLLKAAAGGGGKGMRFCADPARLPADFEAARRETVAAFGDGTIYLEKALCRPRHVEVQVFGDGHGGAVHFFERDCSVQRRHQKVVEETPSPAVDADLCARMGEIAVRAARAVDYVGAGTVEFLLDESGRFYFLEMNTRLQVEHPITELVTGIDLVRWQIEVAAGSPLPLAQERIVRRGAAVECRVYAEDPVSFLPSPGRIGVYREPSGPGVRVDSGVESGSEVTPLYDPLLAKLCAFGADRAEALARMRRALGEYVILGPRTNLPLHLGVLGHPDFAAGRYDTGFLERHAAEIRLPTLEGDALAVAAVVAALGAESRAGETPPPGDGTNAWRAAERWRRPGR